jgi:hypothetical protein
MAPYGLAAKSCKNSDGELPLQTFVCPGARRTAVQHRDANDAMPMMLRHKRPGITDYGFRFLVP